MKYGITGLMSCMLVVTFLYAQDEDPREILFLSTPDQVAALRMSSEELIGGVVCPLSGQPVIRQTDLDIKGAQPLKLERVYIPIHVPSEFPKHKNCQEEYNKKFLQELLKDHYKGWQFFPHLRLQWNQFSKVVRLADSNGITVDFSLSGHGYSTTSLSSLPFGISNVQGELPSGKYDLRNTRLHYDLNLRKMTAHMPDGTVRVYGKQERVDQTDFFLLEKETLPNGAVVKYDYNEKGKLSRVQSLDPKEESVYATLNITGSPWEEQCHFETSTQLHATYRFQKKEGFWKIKDKIRKGGKYQLESHYIHPPQLTSVSNQDSEQEALSYDDRYLLGSVNGINKLFSVDYRGFGGEGSRLRAYEVSFPVGINDAFTPVFKLSYQPPSAGKQGGVTTVINHEGAITKFHFSKEMLTTAVQFFDLQGTLRKEKRFGWTPNQWLQSIEIVDGDNQMLSRRQFEYDRFGNPIVEIFSGNLTGEGHVESYTIRRVFSEDGKNLLLTEEEESGRGYSMTYLAGTDLVTSKLSKVFGQIVKREFKVYDAAHQLIEEIVDDGSGEDKDDLARVTQRSITRIVLRNKQPFLHLPESVSYSYLESGEEKMLSKHQFAYDRYGNIIQDEVYDAEGALHYTIHKTYNEKGALLTETNQMGQEVSYSYDARGNRKAEGSFSKRRHCEYVHDILGRRVEEKKIGDDGVIHATSFVFDPLNHVVRKKDQFENTMSYRYDSIVGKPIRVDYPQLLSGDGLVYTASIQSTYDPMGRLLSETDENENVTSYFYNAYGSILQIKHPHGAVESFRYEKNGQLLSHTDVEGLTLRYARDPLGRVLSKTYVSVDGKELCQETYVYQGDLLLSETDKMGNMRSFTYDGAGRKIKEEFCGRVVEYAYDSFGWISQLRKHNAENSLIIHYERDVEGRILEEKKMDCSGAVLYQINYAYDADGNQESIIRHINGQEAIETFTYDSFGRLVEYIDAEGQVQSTTFNEHYLNVMGQRVLQVTTIDPVNVATVETYDARGKPIRAQIIDKDGDLVACREMRHDPHGNILLRRDQIFENGLSRDIQTVKYTYTPTHQIEMLKRAWGAKESRTTHYSYLPSGKIHSKTLPDGITLTYGYHPLGFITCLDSSDDQIHHRFTYNLLGHLVEAVDDNLALAIHREIDPFGNVVQENFPCGLSVSKGYDHFNRILFLKMANQGEVRYTYDPLYLREVTRISNLRGILYIHVYKDYDRDGNLLAESLIGNVGEVLYTTDLKGQIASISSPFFAQECMYDVSGKLMSTVVDRVEHLQYYDRLAHLFVENSQDPFTLPAQELLFSKTSRNGKSMEMNDIYELLSLENGTCSYDPNKNQIVVQTPIEAFCFTYDPLNRVIEVSSETKKVHFVYDPLGRRMSKVVYDAGEEGWNETLQEHYVYHGQDEIGAFNALEQPKNLRVIGLTKQDRYPRTIGVELEGQIFVPLLDVQGNIRRLLHLNQKYKERGHHHSKAHAPWEEGIDKSTFNPWYFASTRVDPELASIYFAKRLYDPDFAQWIAYAMSD